jgi:hypothetical protein
LGELSRFENSTSYLEISEKDAMILIFSPQNWSHQFISKHHYAIAFSKQKKTLFFEPTTCKLGKYQIKMHQPYVENKNLTVVKITLPFPDVIRFKANSFFKRINASIIKKWIKKISLKPELMIDFGCHTSIANWSFMDCEKKVYFPVDDFENLPIEERGCNAFFSVSSNIQEKFNAAGIPMKFMHHGLNHWFAEKAEIRLKEIESGLFKRKNGKVRIAYSGNLTIPFLDQDLIIHLVSTYQDCEFHFFGKNDSADADYVVFLNKLNSFENTFLHGQLTVEQLAEELFEMDAMLLCYKPDNKNYHAENSHKINEYLSTGTPLISTPISVLKKTSFTYEIHSSKLAQTNHAFLGVMDEIKNSDVGKMKERIVYALKFGYEVNLKNLNLIKF